ncbi:MAG: amidohydrolase family protein [bacterium]|nr:amidohydrolase [Gammaproteobacteria bacterium]HIL97369.1 amidohydrolase [Pseudomonadales bacterium]
MAYVENQTIHDADSHVMELPGTIDQYLEEEFIESFQTKNRINKEELAWADKARELQDDATFRAGDEDNILLRKNHQALGSFRNQDRTRALDLLGFTSQLVFTTTALSNYGLEYSGENRLAVATAQAHNRMMTDFCSVDHRLLATGYVPLVDIEAAISTARQAIDLGCKALVLPSRCPMNHSPSHAGFDPLWALAQEAGIPILFHVGGEEKMPDAYAENGGPRVKDFHGGDENFTSLSFMTIPLAMWQTMSALILDGVCDRFPNLKFGAIELGASWVPSWMQFLDASFGAFYKGEERLKKLSAKPSEIAQRQFRVTPYPHENTRWIIENSSEDMLLFSSDFPHVEGGRNPLKRFNDSLTRSSESVKQKFYRDNFIDMMGSGLDKSLHDHNTQQVSKIGDSSAAKVE